MRSEFVDSLKVEMRNNSSIYVLLGDLGFGIFDSLREDFPKRCINVGSSEQLMIGMATGMALEGKIPVCYSISSFLIYRPFEFIRNYLHNEGIAVKLVGSGRDFDYVDAGFTHHSPELRSVLASLNNIDVYWPQNKKDLVGSLDQFFNSSRPSFLSLIR